MVHPAHNMMLENLDESCVLPHIAFVRDRKYSTTFVLHVWYTLFVACM